MTNPGAQTALTASELTRLANTTDDVVVQSNGIARNLDGAITGELMPRFRGDAANAANQLHMRVQEDTRVILQNTQAMSDQVKNTNQSHQSNDSNTVAGYSNLAGQLNG